MFAFIEFPRNISIFSYQFLTNGLSFFSSILSRSGFKFLYVTEWKLGANQGGILSLSEESNVCLNVGDEAS